MMRNGNHGVPGKPLMNRQVIVLVVLGWCAACAQAQTPADLNAEGVAQYNAGHWNEAIQAFERAYEAVPDNAIVRRNLCNAHQSVANAMAREADFAAASKHLEIAIGVDPENYSPLIQLGSYYLRLDLVPEAIARLEEAIDLAPHNVDAHDLLGDAYYADNDIPSAMTQWKWVAEAQPNRPGLQQKIEKASREDAVEASFRPSASRHFQFSYSPDIPGRALRRLLNFLERAYLEIGRNFGSVYPPTPIQVIVYNAKEFTEATQAGEHIGALYDGKIRIPLYEAQGSLLDDSELKQRLYHEYTHVVVRFLAGNHVPWWLNEGLAEEFSRAFGSLQLDLLGKAKADDALFALASIEDGQMNKLGPDPLRLAYAQSHATAHYLWTKFGQRRVVDLMSALTQGVPPEEALRQSFNRTYATLQKEVARTIDATP